MTSAELGMEDTAYALRAQRSVASETRARAVELCSIAACEGVSLARASLLVYGPSMWEIPDKVWRLAQQARLHMYWHYRESMEMSEVLYQDTVLEAEYLLRDGWCP